MTVPSLPLQHDSAVLDVFERHVEHRRCVFLTGLPGTGKSLLLQQLGLLAHERGRIVHVLQWDIARTGFEAGMATHLYPEVDGVTHPAIRQAAGLWVRPEIERWHREHSDPAHLLLGEVPLVGGRFVELAQRHDDDAEQVLAGTNSVFLITAPTPELRADIEKSRARDLKRPRHQRDKTSAAVAVLEAQWDAVIAAARHFGIAASGDARMYDPDLYLSVFQAVLRHRHAEPLRPSRRLPVTTSAHAHGVVASELLPTPEAAALSTKLVSYLPRGYDPSTHWFQV